MQPFIGMARAHVEPCADGGAYVGSLSMHPHMGNNVATTALSRSKSFGVHVHLFATLVTSIRLVERCRRPFYLLLGTAVNLPPSEFAKLRLLDVQIVRVPPVFNGVACADKLHAWRLTQFSRVVVLDSDMLVIRPLDALFDASEPELTIAHHTSELTQGACGIPLEQRGISALFSTRPSPTRYAQLVEFMRSKLTPYAWSKVSDQWGIACFFHGLGASRTLPGSFLFHVWPGKCSGDGNPGCHHFGNFTRQKVCPTLNTSMGSSVDGGLECFLRGQSCPLLRQTSLQWAALAHGRPPAWSLDDPNCLVSPSECDAMVDANPRPSIPSPNPECETRLLASKSRPPPPLPPYTSVLTLAARQPSSLSPIAPLTRLDTLRRSASGGMCATTCMPSTSRGTSSHGSSSILRTRGTRAIRHLAADI